jgi:hypothetical protein
MLVEVAAVLKQVAQFLQLAVTAAAVPVDIDLAILPA